MTGPKLLFRKAGVFVCPNVRSIESAIGGILQIAQLPKSGAGDVITVRESPSDPLKDIFVCARRKE